MVDRPNLSLKVIVVAHFILTVWASMMDMAYLNGSYIYMNAFILAFGFWAIVCPESVDAVSMYLVLNVISIVLDIVFIGIFASLYGPMHEHSPSVQDVNLYRFCLGMSITNLLIKPFTSFVLYRIYQDRGGSYGENIPGIPGFTSFNFPSSRGNYENIDQASAPPGPKVETAAPYTTAGY